MQSNTGKSNLFDFNDNEKIKVEEMFVNYKMMDVIKELMEVNNIKTKAELAAKMDVSRAYISKLFRSDKNFNVNFIVRAQRVFDTTFTFSARSLQKPAEKDISKEESIVERIYTKKSLADFLEITKGSVGKGNIVVAKEKTKILVFERPKALLKPNKNAYSANQA